MNISVVICSHDRPGFLEDSLTRIVEVCRDAEIIVVDSASPVGVISSVAAGFDVQAVRTGERGLSIARNAGVAAASGDVVAFTDDDCSVAEGWLSVIADAFSDPRVGIVTGRVVADEQPTFVSSVDERTESFDFSGSVDPSTLGHGANMAFRRSAMVAFDELLGAGARFRAAEDTDMFWRVLRAGWAGRFMTESVVTHHQWRSTREAIAMSYGYGLGAGAFASKARRIDPGTAWPVPAAVGAREARREGLRHLRTGYQSGAVAEVLRARGLVRGAKDADGLAIEGSVFRR